MTCGVCGEDLVLFVQLSAGYGDYPKRLLHLFGCRQSTCGADVKAWRVLRSTGPQSSRVPKVEDVAAKTAAKTGGGYTVDLSDWATDDWSVPEDAVSNADAEIEALLAARSAGFTKAAGTAPSAPSIPKKKEEAEEDVTWLGVREAPRRTPDWPCFSLSVDYEPWETARSEDYEQELWQRYLQSELAEEDASSMSGPMPKELEAEAANLQREGDALPSSGHEAGYGDEDEDDDDAEEALRAGDHTTKVDWLMRFQRRIGRSPQQVLRYCWGGEPLWLQAPPAMSPPRCTCGAVRCFEMQLMPTLPSRLADAAPKEKAAALMMEWGTLVVFTCSKDCPCEDPKEEFLVIQPAE